MALADDPVPDKKKTTDIPQATDGRIPTQQIKQWRRERSSETFRSLRSRIMGLIALGIKALIVGFACLIVGRLAGSGLEGAWLPYFGILGVVATLIIGLVRLNHLYGILLLGGGGCLLCIASRSPNLFPMAGFVALGTFVSLWLEYDRA